MRGDSESASKNTSNPTFKYPNYSKSNIRIFENSLASDLVFVNISTPTVREQFDQIQHIGRTRDLGDNTNRVGGVCHN